MHLEELIHVYDVSRVLSDDFTESLLTSSSVLHEIEHPYRSSKDARKCHKIFAFKKSQNKFTDSIFNVTNATLRNYLQHFHHSCTGVELFPLSNLRVSEDYFLYIYREGDLCDAHVDVHNHVRRELSLILMLNDDYEGGDLEFYCGDTLIKTIKAKKNAIVIFPSNFVFVHRVAPITKGTRIVIVYWLCPSDDSA